MEQFSGEDGAKDPEIITHAIEVVTDLDILSEQNRADLALVILGAKPACGVSFGEQLNVDPKGSPRYRMARTQIEEILNLLKLPYTAIVDNFGEEGEGVTYYVAKNQEAMEAVNRSFIDTGGKRTIEERAKFGLAMGYPATAVEAWEKTDWSDNTTVLDHNKPPPELVSNEAYSFNFFSFSRDHWKEELPVAEEWARKLKAGAPRLYEKLLNREKPMNT